MNLRENITKFLKSNAIPLKEATSGQLSGGMGMIDPDDNRFRRLNQQSRDLSHLTAERQREIAYHMVDTNPFAKRVIEMKKDFIVGDVARWTITAEDEKVQDILDAHWNDPVNDWPSKLESRVRELGMSGEQCYTVETGADGIVRLGYVDPGVIVAVKTVEDNFEVPHEIFLQKKIVESEDLKLKVVRYDMAQKRLVGLMEGEEDQYESACFFFAVNKPIKATRGRSDLFSMSDGIDMLDKFHWNRMERTQLMNAYIWDWTCDGLNGEEIKAFAKSQGGSPSPGSSRYHNESVKVEAVTPNLQSADASQEGRMMRTPLLVGAGLPEMWLFGVGEDANRASAYEMGDPPMRMLRARQNYVSLSMIVPILRYQIAEAIENGRLSQDVDQDFTLDVPEISSRDMKKIADTLESVGRTLSAATGTFLSRETATEMFAFVASQVGMDVDAEQEKERLTAEGELENDTDLEGLFLPQNGAVDPDRALVLPDEE